ncbi:MAG: iron-containing alcohol dehydrogenase [Solibacillus sp.]|uniref:iron-containing alcohol dehydrogenase n=1 Tax=Solibacillus sp. TaxID=1909654 RepID=UPI003315CB33
MKTTSYFEFTHRPEIRSGAGSHILVPDLIQGLGGKRPVLFSDKGLTDAGLTQKIKSLFDMVPGIKLAGVFDDIQQDAKSSNINRGLKYFKECNGDSIIAIGGGSVLDTAKTIKWALYNGVNQVEIILTGNVLEVWPDAKPFGIPHISIPTTSGTGAEISSISVVLNEILNLKCNLMNPYLCSDIAVLDPDLTVGLPPRVTAFTGMDALTHAVEGFFSTKSTNFSDAFALHSAKIIVENLTTAVHDGKNVAARANMLQASAMAITSFQAAMANIPIHNIAHTYGAKYGIPHGLANAVLMPSVMKNMPNMYLPKVNAFASALGIIPNAENPQETLDECINVIVDLRNAVKLPPSFDEFNIDAADIPQLVPAVQNDPSSLSFRIPDDIIVNVSKEVISSKVSI